MKNLSVILNAVLIVAVGVLYFLHFSSRNKEGKISGTQLASSMPLPERGIVYINSDTLNIKYDMSSEMRKEMEIKQKRMEGELEAKSKDHEKKVADFYDKQNKGVLLRSEMESIYKDLSAEEQNLLKLRQEMTMQLQEEEQVMNRKLINNVVEYLKEFNKNGKYTYIFSRAFGSNLLYATDSLNITEAVVKGLNEEYAHSKKEKK